MSDGDISEIKLANIDSGKGSIYWSTAVAIRSMFDSNSFSQRIASEIVNQGHKASDVSSFKVFFGVLIKEFDPKEEKFIIDALSSLFKHV